MTTAFTPVLLTDKSRLQEIYDLRVDAWENSEKREFVNGKYFPCGWKDSLDDDAFHWIVEHENKIIASARVSILNHTKDMKTDFDEALIPRERPFAYFSRLVIAPKYRELGITSQIAAQRIEFSKERGIPFALIIVNAKRIPAFKKIGFVELGTVLCTYDSNPKINTCTFLMLNM